MRIELYKSKAEKIKLNKLNDLILLFSINGTLREGTSIINPSLLFQFDIDNVKSNKLYIYNEGYRKYLFRENTNLVLNTKNSLLECNYVYVEDFHRYYFVNNIISVRKNLWQIDLHCDVLMSFSNEILNTKAFVTRNEYLYDSKVKDNLTSFKYNKYVDEKYVTDGPMVDTQFNPAPTLIDDIYTVTVINGSVETALDYAETPMPGLLPRVASWCTGTNSSSSTYVLYQTYLIRLIKALVSETYSNLSDGVLSIMAYPFTIPATGQEFPLKIKDEEITSPNVNVRKMAKKGSQYLVVADFTYEGTGDFTDYEPYAEYELWIPYCQWVKLSADQIVGKRLLVIYEVNYSNGKAQVSIVEKGTTLQEKILWTSSCQLGVYIPVNSTNAYDVSAIDTINNIALALNLTNSLAVGTFGAMTVNPMMIAGGSYGMANAVNSYLNNAATNYIKASGSVSEGLFGLYLPQKVRLRKTYMIKKSYNEDWFKIYGRPLNEFKYLKELKGYTLCGDFHLEDFINTTDTEISEIENILKSGIIL